MSHGPHDGNSHGMTSSVRVVGGWSTTRDAEHGYREVGRAAAVGPAFVGTTFEPVHRVVVHLAEDVAELPDRTRVFVFPGHDGLVGTVTVGEVLRTTGIDLVRGLATTFPSVDDRLDTQEFVRPVVEGGRLVLVVRPGRDAGLVPFEQPNPTPCCADHA